MFTNYCLLTSLWLLSTGREEKQRGGELGVRAPGPEPKQPVLLVRPLQQRQQLPQPDAPKQPDEQRRRPGHQAQPEQAQLTVSPPHTHTHTHSYTRSPYLISLFLSSPVYHQTAGEGCVLTDV